MDGCLRTWKSLGGSPEHVALALHWKKGTFAETVVAVAMHLAKAVATAHSVANVGTRFGRGLGVLYLLRHHLLSSAWKS